MARKVRCKSRYIVNFRRFAWSAVRGGNKGTLQNALLAYSSKFHDAIDVVVPSSTPIPKQYRSQILCAYSRRRGQSASFSSRSRFVKAAKSGYVQPLYARSCGADLGETVEVQSLPTQHTWNSQQRTGSLLFARPVVHPRLVDTGTNGSCRVDGVLRLSAVYLQVRR